MDINPWLSLIIVCTLGAISPGPSVAIIIKVTAKNGRNQGILAAIGHGLGIGGYAFLAVAGIAITIEQSPVIFSSLKIMGAVFLAYIGFQALGVKRIFYRKFSVELITLKNRNKKNNTHNSFIIGFLTAVLNPKVAIFFIALFSQFINEDNDIRDKIIIATIASTIDTLWYCIVATTASNSSIKKRCSPYGKILEKGFGILLIILAAKLVLG
jgi:threonine/homoserine/homoserine lactone efflux protein